MSNTTFPTPQSPSSSSAIPEPPSSSHKITLFFGCLVLLANSVLSFAVASNELTISTNVWLGMWGSCLLLAFLSIYFAVDDEHKSLWIHLTFPLGTSFAFFLAHYLVQKFYQPENSTPSPSDLSKLKTARWVMAGLSVIPLAILVYKGQSVDQSAVQSVDQSVGQSVDQSAVQSAVQSAHIAHIIPSETL